MLDAAREAAHMAQGKTRADDVGIIRGAATHV
jgi:hypothetical protein